ncbi:MAG: hypothetical protein HY343_12185, partial [Lentisphaerae bacterium]|nr:hypothetical protein [Lentisphaerota bacterium]
MKKWFSYLPKLLVSMGVSCITLALIFKLVGGQYDSVSKTRLIQILTGTSLPLFALAFLSSVMQALFRSLRYRLLIAGGGLQPPRFFPLILITMTRNML